MMDFLIYEGKVAVVLLVFYLFYRFLLRKETFHRFNRIVLVGTAILSFLLPLCVITIRKPAEPGVMVMEMTAQMRELAPVVGKTFPSWPVLLVILLFWAGAAFVLVRVIALILSILKIIRQGELVREDDGCKVVVTDHDIAPFSWMRYVVLPRKDWEGPHETIIAHEKAHVGYRHSVELLLVDIFSALQWFNPAIWMLRSDLRELHEYEADDAVLRSGVDIKEYQYLLIRKAVGKSGYSVANSFNHSILKNRITMMSKSKSPLARGLRVLWALPLVCLAIGLQARTVYVPSDKDSNNLAVGEVNPDNPKKIVNLSIDTAGNVTVEGKEVEKKDLVSYFRSMDTHPEDIIVQLHYDQNTPREELTVINDVGILLRQAGVFRIQVPAMAQMVDVSNQPLYILRDEWGKEKEVSFEETYRIPHSRLRGVECLNAVEAREKYGEKGVNGAVIYIMKRPQELDEIVVISYAEEDDGPIPFFLANPDTMPLFQGEGMDTFSRWLNVRIRRPKGCTHEGEMKVSFVVGTDGKVRDVKVTQSVCESLDAMVTSIIEQSPKWEPATVNGDPVVQCLSIPIAFKMR
ncbi:MAG: energy transducer TonB [Bacteroidales bacterium]|nr:energy transducer TonB [Bacteroidales bacterium]